MTLAFSLTHDHFVPVSFEEKYTIGEVPISRSGYADGNKAREVAEELKYRPVAIIKGHGTVAIGKNLQEAFLLTDLLEEAAHCRFFMELLWVDASVDSERSQARWEKGRTPIRKSYVLFSQEHMADMVERANHDSQFRNHGERDRSLYIPDTSSGGKGRLLDCEIYLRPDHPIDSGDKR